MRREPFRIYLSQRDEQAESTLASDCFGYAIRAEEALGFNLDNADLSSASVNALVGRLMATTPSLPANECSAALHAYGQFMTYYKARCRRLARLRTARRPSPRSWPRAPWPDRDRGHRAGRRRGR